MFSLITPSLTISASKSFSAIFRTRFMPIFFVPRKTAWFSALTLTLLFLGGCALFQPNDCEVDDLPDEILTDE